MKLRVLVATVAIAASVPAGVGIESACASEGPRAVLVVNAGDNGGVHRYCVALPAQSVSGIRLIQLANEQHGLAYRLDHGGQAVCMLAGVGPAEGDCFGEYPDFWGYFRGDGSGGWRWSNTGAGSTIVGDGDVDGWSWGRGGSPSSHPKPPRTRFADACPATKSQGTRPAPRAGGGGAEPAATGGAAVSERSEERAAGRRGRDGRGDEGTRARAASPRRALDRSPFASPQVESSPAAAPAVSDGGSTPPRGGLVALAATLALAAAGAFAARRRRRG